MLALAVLFGVMCLFFGAVGVTGRRESPLGELSWTVFLTIRLLGAGLGLRKLRQAGFNPRLPTHWMLLAFSLSLLLGALGTTTSLSYDLLSVPVPYPSLADIGFAGQTLLWVVGLVLFYVALETTVREEVGPFMGLLTAAWSLTPVLIGLALGTGWASTALPKLATSVYYPFVWALSAALAGSLVLGPKFKQLTGRWRGFVAVVYAASVVLFLTNIAYAVSAAVPIEGPSAKYLYHSGGPLDFLFASGNYLLMVGIVLLPLGRPLFHAQQDALAMAGGQPSARTTSPRTPEARPGADRPRTRRTRVPAGRSTRSAAAGHGARTVQTHARDNSSGPSPEEIWALLKDLRAEVQDLRRDFTGRGDHQRSGQPPRPVRSRTVGASRRRARPGTPGRWQDQ